MVEISQFAFLQPKVGQAQIAQGLSALVLNERPLGPPQSLHACFNKGHRAALAHASLLRGLQKIDSRELADRYMEHLGQEGAVSN